MRRCRLFWERIRIPSNGSGRNWAGRRRLTRAPRLHARWRKQKARAMPGLDPSTTACRYGRRVGLRAGAGGGVRAGGGAGVTCAFAVAAAIGCVVSAGAIFIESAAIFIESGRVL